MFRWQATALALVLGCAQRPANVAPTTAPEPVAPSRDDPERDDVAVISGRVRAHDGGPLRAAQAMIQRHGFAEPIATVPLDPDGAFSVEVPPGLYYLRIAAGDHANAWRQAVVERTLSVEGRLGTYARKQPGDAIRVRSKLLDADGKVIGAGPKEAKRTDAGSYRITLVEPPAKAVRLRYQLVADGGGRTYNGPLADELVSDGGGDYWSIVELAEHPTLDLDLRTLPPAGLEPALEWRGEPEHTRSLHAFISRWQRPLDDLRREIPRADGKILTMTEANHKAAAELARRASDEIDPIEDAELRTLLQAARLSLFAGLLVEEQDPAWRRKTLEWTIENVAPTDVHLALVPNLDHMLVRALREADPPLVARTEAWLERRATENPEPGLAIEALAGLHDQAERRHDLARAHELYARAQAERFVGTHYREFLRVYYDPERPLQSGKPLPAFEFAALDGGTPVSSSALAGHVYLLEFWATWCGPCVVEMPGLHDAYARINGARAKRAAKNGELRKLGRVKAPRVEFVFVSFDGTADNVAAFRKKHWSMPWTHAFVGQGGQAEVMKQFGFSGVPTAILVDERGVILEVGSALRGDELQATLERVLSTRAQAH